jgi:hypothetical protein
MEQHTKRDTGSLLADSLSHVVGEEPFLISRRMDERYDFSLHVGRQTALWGIGVLLLLGGSLSSALGSSLGFNFWHDGG